MYDFDHGLFLALNFDGGETMDHLMHVVSGTPMWIPLYLLILYLVWRQDGWKGLALFFVLMVGAIVLADMVSGIFKHNGLLGSLLPDFEPRWRPMFTPSLEDLSIAPDSLYALRRMTMEELHEVGIDRVWTVHVPLSAVSGKYGTVSAHAATVVTLAALACGAIRRRWFLYVMIVSTILICYSRIYLAKHFPMDLAWGTLVGLCLGGVAWWIYKKTIRQQRTK